MSNTNLAFKPLVMADWEELLVLYVHDYLVKTNSIETAKKFLNEVDVPSIPIAVHHVPGSLLKQWWIESIEPENLFLPKQQSDLNQQVPIPVDTRVVEIGQMNLQSQMKQFKMNQPMVGRQFQGNRPCMNQKMPLHVDPTPYCVPNSAVPRTRLHNPGLDIEILRSISTPPLLQRFMKLDPQLQKGCLVLAQGIEKLQLGLGIKTLKAMMTGGLLEWIKTFKAHYLNERAAQIQMTIEASENERQHQQQFQDNKPWMNQQMLIPVDTVPAEIEQTNLHSQMQQFMMNQQKLGDNRPWSNQKIPISGDTVLAEIGQMNLQSQMQQFKMNQPMVGRQFQDNRPWVNQKMPPHVDPTPYRVLNSAVQRTRLHNPGLDIELLKSNLTETQFQQLMMLDPQLQQKFIVLVQEMEKKQLGLGTEWIQTLKDHYLNERAAQTQMTVLKIEALKNQRQHQKHQLQQQQQQQLQEKGEAED